MVDARLFHPFFRVKRFHENKVTKKRHWSRIWNFFSRLDAVTSSFLNASLGEQGVSRSASFAEDQLKAELAQASNTQAG